MVKTASELLAEIEAYLDANEGRDDWGVVFIYTSRFREMLGLPASRFGETAVTGGSVMMSHDCETSYHHLCDGWYGHETEACECKCHAGEAMMDAETAWNAYEFGGQSGAADIERAGFNRRKKWGGPRWMLQLKPGADH